VSEQNNKDVLNQFIEQLWNRGNFDLLDKLVAPRYTIHHDPGDPWEGQTLSRDEFKKRVLYSRTAFPDLCFTINEFVAEKNRVVISWYLTGTHKGDLAQVPASGKKIRLSGLTIYYFSDGKINGHWQVIDQLAFLAQVGMLGLSEEG
jgi:steroid delta-isomerase-like uncharacterized protein